MGRTVWTQRGIGHALTTVMTLDLYEPPVLIE
jgi:hypothetical protein